MDEQNASHAYRFALSCIDELQWLPRETEQAADTSKAGRQFSVQVPASQPTGQCTLTFVPAASGEGISFRRVDLPGKPLIRAALERAVAMCERGHADQMILSQDANCFSDWFPPGMEEQVTPNWHFLHVIQDVVPALLVLGFWFVLQLFSGVGSLGDVTWEQSLGIS